MIWWVLTPGMLFGPDGGWSFHVHTNQAGGVVSVDGAVAVPAVVVDVDGFRELNSQEGHVEGILECLVKRNFHFFPRDYFLFSFVSKHDSTIDLKLFL
jgi:hypothetical protein